MATSDDPPFLNVGTEVSAKYRGAFCEATIKIAKKVVKCKISYMKGQTDTVPNDLIKGPLKVGATVDVRQSDGQYLSGIIQKLTDASTYTVVFDDGDERTLKRSSLCLKGGRHYSASESLDQMPLTDPENFGTPAHFQSKRGTRRRRHTSQSCSPEAESQSPVKNPPPSRYPPEYPVGKCVFLENDRRRAGWVPGVIVPAHYVMDESEMSEDTICIRSFKDGRFFAAKTSELHDFASDKEPLCSMLDGEIQPMYMCKPAIERAMAYIDTNELPWNMDLFGSNEEHRSRSKDRLENGCESQPATEEKKQEMEEFFVRLTKFHEEKGSMVNNKPSLAGKDLDLYKLYCLVKEKGGMEKVTQELKWRSLYLQMGMPQVSNSSHLIKQAYKKHLHAFEMYEKARQDGKPVRSKRRSTVHESDDEQTKMTTRSDETTRNHHAKENSSSQLPLSSTGSSRGGDSKDGSGLRGIINLGEYKPGDRVNVFYGKGKTQTTYEAKINEVEQITPDKVIYYVHYNGWNTRYDEWVEMQRIAGKATGPGGRHSGRGSYSKKKHGRLRAQHNDKSNSESDASTYSNGVANSPGTIQTSETQSYSSGGESGSVKTPRSTGNVQRRRMSSATETTSTCSGSNSDNPQSPDSIPSSYLGPNPMSHPPSNSPSLMNRHPLTKQYPLSPPVSSPLSSSALRVPPILSPDGSSHDTISLRTPPQEDCRDVMMESADDDSKHQLIIKKEENVEYVEDNEATNVSSESMEDTKVPKVEEEEEDEEAMETGSPCRLKNSNSVHMEEDINDVSSPSSVVAQSEDVNATSKADQQHLDAAYSLMQVTSAANGVTSHLSPPSISTSTCLSTCASVILSSVSTDSSSQPLSPPAAQSENSSIASSSTESDHELSMMMLDSKRSLSSISPDMQQQEDQMSPRKRKGGHDSGVENGSESDGPDMKRIPRSDLDFSIDMTDLNGLSTTERIGKILERMKDIQKRYMELKAEVTYLDRKRRRARRREREAKVQLSSPTHSTSLPMGSATTNAAASYLLSSSTPHTPSLLPTIQQTIQDTSSELLQH